MFTELKPENVTDADIQVLVEAINKIDAINWRSPLSLVLRKMYYTLGDDQSIFLASVDDPR